MSSATPMARLRWIAPALVVVAAVGGIALWQRGSDHASTPVQAAVPPTLSTTTQGQTVTTKTAAAPSTTTQRVALTGASRLSLQGIGPVAVGMTLPEASKAAGTPIHASPGSAVNDDCSYARADEGPSGVAFMVTAGRIVRIDVLPSPPETTRPAVATVSGIRVGSTEQEVKDAYPGQISVQAHPYLPSGHYLVYTPTDPGLKGLGLVFETDGRNVTSFRSGQLGPVQLKERCG